LLESINEKYQLCRKLNGIAGGIAGVVKDCIIPSVHGTVQTVGGAVWRKSKCGDPEQAVEATEGIEKSNSSPTSETGARTVRGSIMSILSLEKFESK